MTFNTINILLTKTISKANGRLVFIGGAPIGIDSRRWKKNKRKSTNHGFHAFNIGAYIVISYVTIFLHMWLCVDCVKGNWQKEEQQITAFMCVYTRQREREGEAKPSEQVTKATGSQMIGPKSSEGQQRQRQQQQKNCDQKYADSRRVIPLSNPTTTTSRQTDDAASLWRSSNYDDVAFAKATQQIKGGKEKRRILGTICMVHI